MSHTIDHATLMRFLDGELDDEDRRRVEAHLSSCTECRRGAAVYRSVGDASSAEGGESWMRPAEDARDGPATRDSLHSRIARPTGWLLIVVGVVLWLAWGVWSFLSSPGLPVQKLATGALGIGVGLLLVSVAWERWRDWRREPYRDVQR